MFTNSNDETVIAPGLKIEGKVAADGLIKVHGIILGDLHCASLIISEKALVTGTIVADTIVVNGTIEGPIRGGDVVLKSQANVTGDIFHKSLSVEKGARFDGRSRQSKVTNKATDGAKKKPVTNKNAIDADNDNADEVNKVRAS